MANKNTYQLFIQIGDGSGEISPVAEGTQPSKKGQATTNTIGILTAYNAVEPFIQKTQNIILNNVQTQTGSDEVTQRTQIAMNMANSAVKFGVSVAGGASMATALGLSSPFGAVIGGALAIGNKVVDIFSNLNEINNKRIIENEQLSVLRGRAGVQFNRSRGGE